MNTHQSVRRWLGALLLSLFMGVAALALELPQGEAWYLEDNQRGADSLWQLDDTGAILSDARIVGYSGVLSIDGDDWNGGPIQRLGESGWVAIGPKNMDSLTVARLLHINDQAGMVRYVELLHNATRRDLTVELAVAFTLNREPEAILPLPHADVADQGVRAGFVEDDAPAVAFWLGGGLRSQMDAGLQEGSFSRSLTIPAQSTLGVVWAVASAVDEPSLARNTAMWTKSSILSGMPNLAKSIKLLNAERPGVGLDGLRSVQGDTLRLRNGELVRGRLQTRNLTVTGPFGEQTLALESLAGLRLRADGRYDALFNDGQVWAVHIAGELALGLPTWDQVTVPFAEIAILAMKQQAAVKPTAKPQLVIRTIDGQQFIPQQLVGPLKIKTVLGQLEIPATELVSVSGFRQQAHRFELRDGSRFAGLNTEANIFIQHHDGRLAELPWHQLDQIATPLTAQVDRKGTLRLHNGDEFPAQLAAPLRVQTRFKTVLVTIDDIQAIQFFTHNAVQLVFHDGSTLSGRLADDVKITLAWAGEHAVPKHLIQSLRFAAAPAVLQADKELETLRLQVAALGSDDPKRVAEAGAWLAQHLTDHSELLEAMAMGDELPELVRRRLLMIVGKEP